MVAELEGEARLMSKVIMDASEILATSAALVASRAEVKRLQARVEELEAALATRRPYWPIRSGPPCESTATPSGNG